MRVHQPSPVVPVKAWYSMGIYEIFLQILQYPRLLQCLYLWGIDPASPICSFWVLRSNRIGRPCSKKRVKFFRRVFSNCFFCSTVVIIDSCFISMLFSETQVCTYHVYVYSFHFVSRRVPTKICSLTDSWLRAFIRASVCRWPIQDLPKVGKN